MSREELKRGIRIGLKNKKRATSGATGDDAGEPKRDKYGNLLYNDDPLVRVLDSVVSFVSLSWYILVFYTFLQIFVWS